MYFYCDFILPSCTKNEDDMFFEINLIRYISS